MILTWLKIEPLPLFLLMSMLFEGMLVVLVDIWHVRNDGLQGASSSRFGPFRAQFGLVLISIGFSAFLFISPLIPQSWRGNEEFVISICVLYALLALMHFIWRLIWIQQGYTRRERERH